MANSSGTVLRTWDSYVKEAEIAPFELKVSDDETISITNPTGAQVERIASGMRAGDNRVVMLGLFGDQFERINELIAVAGHDAADALLEDVMEHFNFFTAVAMTSPNGQRREVSRPTEITALVRDGWKVEGDFPTSGRLG